MCTLNEVAFIPVKSWDESSPMEYTFRTDNERINEMFSNPGVGELSGFIKAAERKIIE